jgi:hypothetical protein
VSYEGFRVELSLNSNPTCRASMCCTNTQGARHLGIYGASVLEIPPITAYQHGIDDTSPKTPTPGFTFSTPKQPRPHQARFFGLDSKLFSNVQIDSKRGLGSKEGSTPPLPRVTTRTQNFTFSVGTISAEPPCSVATFIVNSEPHTGARPSVRLCGGTNYLTRALLIRPRKLTNKPLLLLFYDS